LKEPHSSAFFLIEDRRNFRHFERKEQRFERECPEFDPLRAH